ncbi:MAG: diguanylate cyclase [Thiobacillus sp.]
MKFRLPDFRISLRTRFALGLGAVLLPFLAAAALGQFYLLPRLVEPLEDIVRELSEEMYPVTRLQTALFQVAMPVNDYLVHGDADERRQFAQLRQRVERAFEEAPPERYTLAEERALIRAARAEWDQALPLGEQLLRLSDPVGNAAAARDMERFDAHIDRAVSMLDEAHHHFHQVLDQDRAQAGVSRSRILGATFAAFVLAGAVSLFTGVALARSVTDPVDTLRQGAARLAEGKLSHRVDIHRHDELGELAAFLDSGQHAAISSIHRHDELGELAAAFNAMAGRIEADQAALAELASRDGLTGLYNHRTFYVLLGDELARAKRFQRPVSLLLLDIDHFKRVNDTHGHLAGDAALRELCELLRREARAVDRVCRYGGEEITLILPETDIEAAVRLAERLRAAVEAQAFDVGTGTPPHLTVSIGAASWPAHADNAQALVAAADAALYAAKRGGRNRVARYEPESAQPAALE